MNATITKQIRTETAHRLTKYDGRCKHLHGHSYLWEITVTAPELDDRGMLMDYKDLKQVLMVTVDPLDHALVLHSLDHLCIDHRKTDCLRATDGSVPRLFLVPFNPTSENLVAWVGNNIQAALDQAFPGVRLEHIRCWETATSYCDWTAEPLKKEEVKTLFGGRLT